MCFCAVFHVVAFQHAANVMGGNISCDLTWVMPLGQTINVVGSSFPESACYYLVMKVT